MGKFTGFPKEGPVSDVLRSSSDLVAFLSEIKRVNSQLGGNTDWILSGADSNKPPACFKNRIYIATDTTPKKIYLDDGASWVLIVG